MYEQAVLTVEDPQRFERVREALASAFSPSGVLGFLKSVQRAGLRIRNFEAVLATGSLGEPVSTEYNLLGNADQGQIREFYLASIEQVAPELRQKFFKLYAYY